MKRSPTATRKHAGRSLVTARKLQMRCRDCGWQPQSEVEARDLFLEHRAGEEKRFKISAGVDRATHTLAAEIAKCDAVCSACFTH